MKYGSILFARTLACMLVLGMVLSGCGKPGTPTTSGTPSPGAYPPPQTLTPGGAYPGPGGQITPVYQPNNPYPVPGVPPTNTPVKGPAFTLNPVSASDVRVTGTGPADLPVILVNVTKAGEVVASTVISPDGKFSFNVVGKIQPNDFLGLRLGIVEGTKFNQNDFLSGPGYTDMPMVGILFASQVVKPNK